jgi:hypothetical protein
MKIITVGDFLQFLYRQELNWSAEDRKILGKFTDQKLCIVLQDGTVAELSAVQYDVGLGVVFSENAVDKP